MLDCKSASVMLIVLVSMNGGAVIKIHASINKLEAMPAYGLLNQRANLIYSAIHIKCDRSDSLGMTSGPTGCTIRAICA